MFWIFMGSVLGNQWQSGGRRPSAIRDCSWPVVSKALQVECMQIYLHIRLWRACCR